MVFLNHVFSDYEDAGDEFENLKSREELQDDLVRQLKKELREKYKSHVIPTDADGWFTREFMIEMHCIMYKFKVCGKDMIAEANFRERISLMEKAEEAKKEGNNSEYTA